jgi:hypothetical protein
MPISSIHDHQRTIGVYQQRHKKKGKSSTKANTAFYQCNPFEEGRAIQQLAHAGNVTLCRKKNEKQINKHMLASSLLNVTILLLSLKPNHNDHNKTISFGREILITSLPDTHNASGAVLSCGNICFFDKFPLRKPCVAGRKTAGVFSRKKGSPAAPAIGSRPAKTAKPALPAVKRHVEKPAKTDRVEAPPYNVSSGAANQPVHYCERPFIDGLRQFINPMKYYQSLFEHEKSDQYGAIAKEIKNNYRTEDVCIRYLKDRDTDIPDRFFYLKKNMDMFRIEINKVQGVVSKALLKLKRSTEKNVFGSLRYHPQNTIVRYLKNALGTHDDGILQQAMLRVEYYLLQLENYFRKYKGNILFATSKIMNAPEIPFQEPLMGFTLPMDSRHRIVVMVDYFDKTVARKDRLRITELAEDANIQVGTTSFVYSPKSRQLGDGNEILEFFDEDIFANGKEAFIFDDLFIKSYENALDVRVDAAQLIQAIKSDPMLQKNIMMDNAHFMAKIIYDIAHYQSYGQDFLSPPHDRKNTNGLGPVFTKALLNLIIKQHGVA